VYATEMDCTEPVGVMDQETVYLQALRAAARFRVDGDRLDLYDEAGTQILAFVAASSVAAVTTQPPSQPSAVLVGTQWVLVSLKGDALIEGTQITLNFADVSLKGSAGCNTYWGSYTASEDGLRLSGMYWTEIGCPEPEGILDQEKAYLDALNEAARYRVEGDRLEVYDETGTQILTFVAATSDAVVATPAPSQPSAAAPTSTPVAVVATAPPAAEPPGGFKLYQDAVAGVAIDIPESWVVTGIVPGQYAILQSYPEDKYVGGEARAPGDTKCDLNIGAHGTSAADLIQQWKSNPDTAIIAEGEILLQSGQTGTVIEAENRGRSLSLISDVNGRAVTLTCWGAFEPFDAIAVTLGAADIVEDMPSTPIEPAAGFKQYHDSVAGVSVNIPESWVVTGVDPGAYAILQSYPEDKYVGGEGRAPGPPPIRPAGNTDRVGEHGALPLFDQRREWQSRCADLLGRFRTLSRDLRHPECGTSTRPARCGL
jgi:heat shock protein HslJ